MNSRDSNSCEEPLRNRSLSSASGRTPSGAKCHRTLPIYRRRLPAGPCSFCPQPYSAHQVGGQHRNDGGSRWWLWTATTSWPATGQRHPSIGCAAPTDQMACSRSPPAPSLQNGRRRCSRAQPDLRVPRSFPPPTSTLSSRRRGSVLAADGYGTGQPGVLRQVLASGTPFVATPNAVGNLDLGGLRHLAVLGADPDLVTRSCQLLTSEDARATFAEATHHLLANHYGPDARREALILSSGLRRRGLRATGRSVAVRRDYWSSIGLVPPEEGRAPPRRGAERAAVARIGAGNRTGALPNLG